jgi:hypothetical protein
VISDRELDIRLAGAAVVSDDDLPALPEDFLAHLTAGAGNEPASVVAARQLVADARDAAARPCRRRPGRKVLLRAGAAVVAVAAAWTTAVVAAPDHPAPAREGVEVDTVALVDFDMPVAPLALPAPPEGTTGPVYGGDAAGGIGMSYASPEDPLDSVFIAVEAAPDPIVGPETTGQADGEDVLVRGLPGRLTVVNAESEDARTVYLTWDRAPGQWVLLMGRGRFADGAQLTALAAALVDSPRSVPVQLSLAPAGYSLDFFKDGGRIVRLADDADPARTRGMTIRVPLATEISGAELRLATEAGPPEEVTVHGRPAGLSETERGFYESSLADGGWLLEAAFPDGTPFVIEAPGTLTRDQVLGMAEEVSYTP